jgi:pyruvate formate lyase activating enzyme
MLRRVSMKAPARMLARKAGGKLIQCTACRRYCRIPEGQAGFCGVRANESGKLRLVVYGRPCAVNIDPIEKKPLFHFLPGSRSFSIGTFGCNFACSFCQNWDISQAPQEARHRDPARWKEYFGRLVERCGEWPPERVVAEAVRSGCKSISFTYNEPTIFTEYAIDVMKLARKKGLRGVYVTNGYESPECWRAIRKHIDAANIDLKAYNKRFYAELCRVPDFEPIKESIAYAKKLGIWVEVTTLIIPDWNDSGKELGAEAAFLASVDPEMPWHITAFHPEYKLLDKAPTPPESLIRAREIGKMAGIRHVYCGNMPMAYSDYETTSCPSCAKALIRRRGYTIEDNGIIDGRCRFCKAAIRGVWE